MKNEKPEQTTVDTHIAVRPDPEEGRIVLSPAANMDETADLLRDACLPKDGSRAYEEEKTIYVPYHHKISLRFLARLYLSLAVTIYAVFAALLVVHPSLETVSMKIVILGIENGLAILFAGLGYAQPEVKTYASVDIRETTTITRKGAVIEQVQVNDDTEDPLTDALEDVGINPDNVSWLYTEPGVHGYRCRAELEWTDALAIEDGGDFIAWIGPLLLTLSAENADQIADAFCGGRRPLMRRPAATRRC